MGKRGRAGSDQGGGADPSSAGREEGGDPIRQVRAFYRFHVRLTLLYGAAVLLTLAAMAFVFYRLWAEAERAGLKQRLLAMATSLAETVDAEAIAAFPVDHAEVTDVHRALFETFARVAKQDPDVETIYILRPTTVPTQLRFFLDYAKDGTYGTPGEPYSAADTPVLLRGFEAPVVEDHPYRDVYGLTLSAYAPLVTKDGRRVGLVGLDVEVSQLDRLRGRVLGASLALFGGSFLVVALVSVLVARSIREPLLRLVAGTSAVARGNFDVRLGLQRRDEFGILGRHFDRMTEGLKERQVLRDLFGCYVSEKIAHAILRCGRLPELGGEEVVVTALFCDLRNHTTVSERLSPAQMVGVLNDYLEAMTELIDAHDGCVIEFLGDGIFAVFGAPSPSKDHAEQALLCALAMAGRLEELNAQWEKAGLAQRWHEAGVEGIRCGIGLHAGEVVAGNLGSRTRMKYSVIGDTVNVAARLEALNKELGTTVLVSEEVRSRLPAPLANRLRSVGTAQVKGRRREVAVYSV
ncbi:MAG: adenylate/guanylate cyclase domain-containing protein [Deferrisomatales bacterium]